MPTWLLLHIKRIALVSIVAFVFSLLFNEIAFRLQYDENERAPRTITFVIPAGTAQRIADGEAVDILPDDQVFVVGDVLRVQNNDQEAHQLGPIWAPPGASGSLVLEKPARLKVDCSFQSARILGLEVRPATTFITRLTGLLLTGPTLGALLYLYSLIAFPLKVKPA
jgi:hypothetical protein